MSDERNDPFFAKLGAGELEAIQDMMMAHEPYLRVVVRRRFPHWLRSKCDSVDIVQSVWASLFPRLRTGQIRFGSFGELKAFLATSARNRLTDRIRQYRSANRCEQSLSGSSARMPLKIEARPSQVVQAQELWERLLALCPPEHHEVVRLRLQGFSLDAIAEETGLHEGSVRRILRRLARAIAFAEEPLPDWQRES